MKESFAIVPATGLTVWVALIVVVLLVGLTALFGWILYSARSTVVELDSNQIHISGTLYGRRIPLDVLLSVAEPDRMLGLLRRARPGA